MREITFLEAVNEAMHEEMARDPRVYLIGEDVRVGYGRGGAFGATNGLFAKFGPERVIDAPISESAIAGTSVGAALWGMRPIAEIMFSDFLVLAMDHIANSAAKMRYAYAGEATVPVVYRMATGAGVGAALHHSQSPEAWIANVPGLKIVYPSTPYDAKGLLKSAVRDDNPVVFFEHKYMYSRVKGPVPEEEYLLPLGKADVKRSGDQVTIIAYGAMLHQAMAAADKLQAEGISAEVVDPRTLLPLDKETIFESVKKTGKVVIVHEAPTFGGFGGEIAAAIADEAFYSLDAPIKRVGAPFTPVPAHSILEKFYLPDADKIVKAVKETFE
ncbi:MAG TPA: alpha-ketoacid dehydrogenase subunit beta [Thermodesulfobacteriota bacterium]|nr:alpha-ketoacid dehydrogenase subunit beta [Thermodesulfobacteriota bacterium]